MKKLLAILVIAMITLVACGETTPSVDEATQIQTSTTAETTTAPQTSAIAQITTSPQTSATSVTTTQPAQSAQTVVPVQTRQDEVVVKPNQEAEPPQQPVELPASGSAPPFRVYFYFDSIDEIFDDFLSKESRWAGGMTNDDVLMSYENNENGEKNKGEFRKFISDIQRGGFLYVPYYNGKEIPFANNQEHRNIKLTSSNFYGRLGIEYAFCSRQSNIVSCTMTFLDKDEQRKSNNMDISSFMADVFPSMPNVHNYNERTNIAAAYVSEIQLRDYSVNALIFHPKNVSGRGIIFVYDNALVSLGITDENFPLERLSDLSFAKR